MQWLNLHKHAHSTYKFTLTFSRKWIFSSCDLKFDLDRIKFSHRAKYLY